MPLECRHSCMNAAPRIMLLEGNRAGNCAEANRAEVIDDICRWLYHVRSKEHGEVRGPSGAKAAAGEPEKRTPSG